MMKRAERYTFYDGPLGTLIAEFFKGKAFLHLSLKAGSVDAVRKARDLFPEVKAILRAIGFKDVYAYNRETETKWQKFMAGFGFTERRRRDGWVLMGVSNAC